MILFSPFVRCHSSSICPDITITMTPFYYFSLALWATSVTGASFSKRADSSFGLYAYGDVIGGLPVFYANSKFLPHDRQCDSTLPGELPSTNDLGSAFVVDQQMAGNAFTSAVCRLTRTVYRLGNQADHLINSYRCELDVDCQS